MLTRTCGRGKTEKSEELRRRIMEASVELFLENGYEKTTTRQILQKTGILNGSLYNIYHSKEEIFNDIIIEAITEVMEDSERYLPEPTFLNRIGFPFILQIHASFMSPRIAELLTIAHKRWDIKEAVCRMMTQWIREKDVDGIIDVDSKNFWTKLHMCGGAMGCVLEAEYRSPGNQSEMDCVLTVIKMMMDMFDLPTDGMEDAVERIHDTICSEDIVICGVHI